MKKIIGIVLSLAAVVTLSSFVIAHNVNNDKTNNPETISVNDDGWELYTTVTAYVYKKNKDGEWVKGDSAYRNTKIERRVWRAGIPRKN